MIAADTYEVAGGRHYNGHPGDREIGHWIAGYGYASSGATSYWADPSTSYYPNASKTFTAATDDFAYQYLWLNGVMY